MLSVHQRFICDTSIFQILREEITPTLTKLKEERSSYLEYQKILREIDHLNKLHVAYQFVCAEVSIMCLLVDKCNENSLLLESYFKQQNIFKFRRGRSRLAEM